MMHVAKELCQSLTIGPSDYQHIPQPLSIQAGELERCGIYINVVEDTDIEGIEYFTVTFSSVIADTFGSITVVIKDNDGKTCNS